MHKILTTDLTREQPFIDEEISRTRGFVIGIEPPISVTQEVVERTIGRHSLNPRFVSRTNPFHEIILVGSTQERTTIYARLPSETNDQAIIDEARSHLVAGTRELLGFLGVNEVEYDTSSPPLSRLAT